MLCRHISELYAIKSLKTRNDCQIQVIFTGGYFPISYMRNDTVNNLNESFSIISFADRKYLATQALMTL